MAVSDHVSALSPSSLVDARRVLVIRQGKRVVAWLSGFLLTPGPVLWVERFKVLERWTPTLRRVLEDAIVRRWPTIQGAAWTRPNDRTVVVIPRRLRRRRDG